VVSQTLNIDESVTLRSYFSIYFGRSGKDNLFDDKQYNAKMVLFCYFIKMVLFCYFIIKSCERDEEERDNRDYDQTFSQTVIHLFVIHSTYYVYFNEDIDVLSVGSKYAHIIGYVSTSSLICAQAYKICSKTLLKFGLW